jgi:uncharacterized protein
MELLAGTRVRVSTEMFSLVSVTKAQWPELVRDPELSPRMTAPFMILMDEFEVTMLLDEIDFATIRSGLANAKVERGFRMLTFESVMDFDVVGFIAEVSRILAGASIPIFPVSAFSRDHVLVKQDDLANALKALGPFVGDLC